MGIRRSPTLLKYSVRDLLALLTVSGIAIMSGKWFGMEAAGLVLASGFSGWLAKRISSINWTVRLTACMAFACVICSMRSWIEGVLLFHDYTAVGEATAILAFLLTSEAVDSTFPCLARKGEQPVNDSSGWKLTLSERGGEPRGGAQDG